jgi:Rad3-related DNA helicase
LQREDVVVAVHNQAGQKIGFAEDEAIGICVVDERHAIGDGAGDALPQQGGKVVDRLARNKA